MTLSNRGSSVIVGYVPTDLGEAVLQAGVEEAALRGLKLVVLNVGRADQAYDKSFADQADRERIEKVLAEHSVEHEYAAIETQEDPAAVIVEQAAERDAALIVIGLRHRSPVGKLLLGSHAQRILVDAPCRVLAVKKVQPA